MPIKELGNQPYNNNRLTEAITAALEYPFSDTLAAINNNELLMQKPKLLGLINTVFNNY